MKIHVYLLIIAVAFISACGGKEAQDLKNTVEVMKGMANAEEINKELGNLEEMAQKRIAERKAKGDTMAINFKKLIDYLPSSISGYTAEKPEGQTINAMGMSYSEANVRYVKGNDDITIKLFDYNASYSIYAGLTIWAQSGIELENSDGYEKSYKTGIEHAYGWEKYNIPNKRAELMIAIGYRFVLSIEASNMSNTDLVKSIANSMKLKELAAM